MNSTYAARYAELLPHVRRGIEALHGKPKTMSMSMTAAPARPVKPLTAAPAPAPAPARQPAARSTPTIDADRFALCVHEAGHAVWAAMSGARITKCSITADGSDGVVRTAEESARAEEIAYAGIWASERWEHGARPSRGALLAAIEAASAEDRECFAAVPKPVAHIEADLEYLYPKIKALAAQLYRNGSATHADVERVLGVRPGLDIDMVAWAHRQRVDPASITVGGAA